MQIPNFLRQHYSKNTIITVENSADFYIGSKRTTIKSRTADGRAGTCN